MKAADFTSSRLRSGDEFWLLLMLPQSSLEFISRSGLFSLCFIVGNIGQEMSLLEERGSQCGRLESVTGSRQLNGSEFFS